MELDLRGTGFLFLLTSNLKGVFVSAGIGPSDRGCLSSTATQVSASILKHEGAASFKPQILPVFLNHCFECHSAQKMRGGLRLDYRDLTKPAAASTSH